MLPSSNGGLAAATALATPTTFWASGMWLVPSLPGVSYFATGSAGGRCRGITSKGQRGLVDRKISSFI